MSANKHKYLRTCFLTSFNRTGYFIILERGESIGWNYNIKLVVNFQLCPKHEWLDMLHYACTKANY